MRASTGKCGSCEKLCPADLFIKSQLSLAAKKGVEKLQTHHEEQDRRAIWEWLAPIDYSVQQREFSSRREEETGLWLLGSDEFKAWLAGSNQTLFCPGIPGAGKTVMTSLVVDHLHAKFRGDTGIGVAYIYCDYRQQEEQKPIRVIANLLKQLSQQKAFLPEDVRVLYQRYQETQDRPSPVELTRALHSVVSCYEHVFIIIDALDEYPVSDGHRRKLLSDIFDLQKDHAANVFATSRYIPDIVREFEGRSTSVEIRASEKDVQRYVDGHMFLLPTFVLRSPDIQEKVRTGISRAADGMYVAVLQVVLINADYGRFLLAQLHLDSLVDKITPKAMATALRSLMIGSEALDCAYEGALERIESQKRGFRDLAARVLAWLVSSKRPLTARELQHALAVEEKQPDLDEDNLPDIEDMVSVCAGLVVIDNGGTIGLVHYTTQEFLERTKPPFLMDPQGDIPATCLTYISFDAFGSGPCVSDSDYEDRLRRYPFYEYAAQKWGYHVKAVEAEYAEGISTILRDESKVANSVQALLAPRGYGMYGRRVPTLVSGLHLCAYFGLEIIAECLVETQGVHADVQDSFGRSPLNWAARNGQIDMVRYLLSRHQTVDPDSRDKHGRTPLSVAAENGHVAIMQLLFDQGSVNADPIDRPLQTPLTRAAEYGHVAAVQLLLARDDVNPNSMDKYNQTPLAWAARNGHDAVVWRLLGDERVIPDCKGQYGQVPRPPLSWAAMNGHETVVRMLLAHGKVDPNCKDSTYGRSPLSWAAGSGHSAIVALLLAHTGVDHDSADGVGRTPLSYAAMNGHEVVVRLLLEKGVNPRTKDFYDQTPLAWAEESGHEAVCRTLISHMEKLSLH
jgi:ankyrin repeat protein